MSDPEVRTPLLAYVLAMISFVFVSGGIFFVSTGAIFIWARSVQPEPQVMFTMMAVLLPFFLLAAVGLGGVSAWQSIQLARKKALEKLLAHVKPTRPCLGCGEGVEIGQASCPMCGREISAV